jgi:preprotein translocase subunit SecG
MTVYRFLLILLIADALVLVAAILMQAGKGGGMAAAFGGASSSDALFGTRQAGNLLTKASWWCGGLFIGIAYILQLSASRGRVPTSVLDKSFTPTKTAPAPSQPAVPPTGTSPVPLQAIPPAPTAKPDSKAPGRGAGTAVPGAAAKAPPPAPTKKP